MGLILFALPIETVTFLIGLVVSKLTVAILSRFYPAQEVKQAMFSASWIMGIMWAFLSGIVIYLSGIGEIEGIMIEFPALTAVIHGILAGVALSLGILFPVLMRFHPKILDEVKKEFSSFTTPESK